MVDFPIGPRPGSRNRCRTPDDQAQRDLSDPRSRAGPVQTYSTATCDNQFILDHIAGHSIAQLNGGWSWKFDDKVFNDLRLGNTTADLAKVSCPVAVIYAAKSALFPAEVIRHMSGLLGPDTPYVVMPKAHHHLFLEQPDRVCASPATVLQRFTSGPFPSATGTVAG